MWETSLRPNAIQNVRNQVVLNASQNPGVQNVRNHNGLSVVSEITNRYGNGNLVTTPAEGNGNGINGNQISKHQHRTQSDKAPFMIILNQLRWGNSRTTFCNVEETRAYHESLFHNIAAEVEKVNLVNRKLRETNADLTTELARYKNQEKCFEISQEKYDKLESCYQKSIYQEQCLTKKINVLHLSSAKTITTLNEKIANLNNQLSKEKSTVSSLHEEKKKLKSDFKIHEDELLDKQIQLENKIKELDNILVKTGQSI
ncbi:hypothetical protein Tco_0695294 [Tanacetum coccineum]